MADDANIAESYLRGQLLSHRITLRALILATHNDENRRSLRNTIVETLANLGKGNDIDDHWAEILQEAIQEVDTLFQDRAPDDDQSG